MSEVAWQLNWHDLLPWCFPKVYLPEQKTPIAKEEIYTSYTLLNDSLDTSMIGVFLQKALPAKNQRRIIISFLGLNQPQTSTTELSKVKKNYSYRICTLCGLPLEFRTTFLAVPLQLLLCSCVQVLSERVSECL